MNRETTRKELGQFCNIVCLKAIITGLEDIIGEGGARANLVLAGRQRGRNLVKSLGLSNTDKPLSEWSAMLGEALGKNGTRLCIITKVEQESDLFRVFLSDTICSAGELPGSPRQLTFTLGAIQGALEEIVGRKLSCTQTGSVLRGQDYDIIELRNAQSISRR